MSVQRKDQWHWRTLSPENGMPVRQESDNDLHRMVHRVIDEIAVKYAGRLNCYVLNTDSDMQVAEDNDIKAVPVVLLFKNGKKFDSVIGTMPKEYYVAAIERVLSS